MPLTPLRNYLAIVVEIYDFLKTIVLLNFHTSDKTNFRTTQIFGRLNFVYIFGQSFYYPLLSVIIR